MKQKTLIRKELNGLEFLVDGIQVNKEQYRIEILKDDIRISLESARRNLQQIEESLDALLTLIEH